MNHPKIGERVRVIPTDGRRVQRGEFMFGQFLPPQGQEVLWDDFLHARLSEGAIRWEPISTEVVNADSSES
jgi:hypothetical protein